MRVVWDEVKRQANLDKHRMDFALIDLGFFASATIVPGKDGRLVAIGQMDVAVAVVFVKLGSEAISEISMRPASRKERMLI